MKRKARFDEDPMDGIADARTLAQAMVDTVRESLLVLDADLRVVAASRSFYATFATTPTETQGRMLYDLGSGEWNNPALRQLLERIVPEHGVMEHFEIEHDVPNLGSRTLLLNARKVFYEGNSHTTLLLAVEDITDRRAAERHLQRLSEQKDTLLAEMSHRVANSLQIIASILLLKARSVQSEETRGHLQDAHRRVMSVAALQQHLKATGAGEAIDVGSYLSKLCDTLAGSMIQQGQPIALRVVAGEGAVDSEQAVSFGLIVTELVINAIKYAFPNDVQSGQVVVGYEAKGEDWKLSVSDNGGGMAKKRASEPQTGLGTTLVKALAQKLEAQVETVSTKKGTTVSITRATFLSHLPTQAASG
ncbi:MAG: sensor histidine kinase [Aestuariivirga sp.]